MQNMTDRHPDLRLKLAIGLGWVTTISVGFALAVSTVVRPTKMSAQAHVLPFDSVQTDLFSVPNWYSNAWADFDNDGDLDLAVSLGSGEVRLYRNDNGTLVSVGKEIGLPQAGGDSYELRGLSWGDYDGDGFVDLLGGATQTEHVTKVFHNAARHEVRRCRRRPRPDDSRPVGAADELGRLRQRRRPRCVRGRSPRKEQAVQERRRHSSRRCSLTRARRSFARRSVPAGST